MWSVAVGYSNKEYPGYRKMTSNEWSSAKLNNIELKRIMKNIYTSTEDKQEGFPILEHLTLELNSGVNGYTPMSLVLADGYALINDAYVTNEYSGLNLGLREIADDGSQITEAYKAVTLVSIKNPFIKNWSGDGFPTCQLFPLERRKQNFMFYPDIWSSTPITDNKVHPCLFVSKCLNEKLTRISQLSSIDFMRISHDPYIVFTVTRLVQNDEDENDEDDEENLKLPEKVTIEDVLRNLKKSNNLSDISDIKRLLQQYLDLYFSNDNDSMQHEMLYTAINYINVSTNVNYIIDLYNQITTRQLTEAKIDDDAIQLGVYLEGNQVNDPVLRKHLNSELARMSAAMGKKKKIYTLKKSIKKKVKKVKSKRSSKRRSLKQRSH
jgi:hypothetical protein